MDGQREVWTPLLIRSLLRIIRPDKQKGKKSLQASSSGILRHKRRSQSTAVGIHNSVVHRFPDQFLRSANLEWVQIS